MSLSEAILSVAYVALVFIAYYWGKATGTRIGYRMGVRSNWPGAAANKPPEE